MQSVPDVSQESLIDSASPKHLNAYLNELAFRFNRRHSRQRGLLFYRLLQQAILAEPVTYRG